MEVQSLNDWTTWEVLTGLYYLTVPEPEVHQSLDDPGRPPGALEEEALWLFQPLVAPGVPWLVGHPSNLLLSSLSLGLRVCLFLFIGH